MGKKYAFIRGGDTPSKFKLAGRNGWALAQLIGAGNAGITPLTHPAPRWSAYIHNLRKMGLVIDTLHEEHAGDFPGLHGRYILRAPVTLVGGA